MLGVDPWRGRPQRTASAIGVVLQHSELPAVLTVREVHRMFAGYYRAAAGRRRGDRARRSRREDRRAREDALRRTEAPARPGVALVGDPELVFLDEPTTGFDPSARRTAWELVRSLRSLGKTILLTTHYLDEAQQLADRVAVIREGEHRPDRDARAS